MKYFPLSRNVAGLPAVLLALAIHSTASAEVGTWEWAEVHPTLRPHALHSADLDQDGDLDAVVITSGELGWQENLDGEGREWAYHFIRAAVYGAYVSAVGDLDGDGDVDIVARDVLHDRVLWLENNLSGAGNWPASFLAINWPGIAFLQLGDFNADGSLDVLLGANLQPNSSLQARLSWFERPSGGGALWVEHSIANSLPAIKELAVADIDGDGSSDFVAAHRHSPDTYVFTATLLLNSSGDGSLWAQRGIGSLLTEPRDMTVGDLDQDGDMDLIWADLWNMYWLENVSGTTGYWSEHLLGAYPAWGLQVTDLEGDGDLDIVAEGGKFWLENEGQLSNWHARPILDDILSYSGGAATLGDFDGDGRKEVMAGTPTLRIARYQACGVEAGFAETHVIREVPTNLISESDIDLDGDLDLVFSSPNPAVVSWLENLDGSFDEWESHVIATIGAWNPRTQVGDLDGDGDPDLLFKNGAQDWMSWAENVAGDGSLWQTHVIADLPSYRLGLLADLDGDGDLDVTVSMPVPPNYYREERWMENLAGDASAWAVRDIELSPFAEKQVTAVPDMDGDGDLDLLFALEGGNQIGWYENIHGDASVFGLHLLPVGMRGEITLALDVEGDGDTDIVAFSAHDRELSWFENLNADGLDWEAHLIRDELPYYSEYWFTSLQGIDYDQDGDQDLICHAPTTYLFENPGSTQGEWSGSALTVMLGSGLLMADLDGDGDIDAVQGGQTMFWEEYDGMLAEEEIRLGVPPNPNALLPAISQKPVPGNYWDPVIDHSLFVPGSLHDFLILSPGRRNQITPYGTLLVDHLAVGSKILRSQTPGQAFSVRIPDTCSMLGVRFSAQGASRGPNGSLELTNAIDVRIGS